MISLEWEPHWVLSGDPRTKEEERGWPLADTQRKQKPEGLSQKKKISKGTRKGFGTRAICYILLQSSSLAAAGCQRWLPLPTSISTTPLSTSLSLLSSWSCLSKGQKTCVRSSSLARVEADRQSLSWLAVCPRAGWCHRAPLCCLATPPCAQNCSIKGGPCTREGGRAKKQMR